MSRLEKKKKFADAKKGPNILKIALIAGAALAVVGIAASVLLSGKSKVPAGLNAGAQTYAQAVQMTDIQAQTPNGDVRINIDDIKNSKLVYFEKEGYNFTLDNGSKFSKLPIMAYIAPSGNVVVATSMCEPCSGTRFRLEGQDLVCQACETRWTLEDLVGVSGGCPNHPPALLKYKVEGNQIVIEKATLDAWKPRPTV